METPQILWSEVTLGTNSSLDQVPFDSCLQSKGTCTVVDGESCSCSFSGIGKLILALYFLASGASLGALFDSVLTYSALLEHEAEEVVRKLEHEAEKSMTRRITHSIDVEEEKKGTIDQKDKNKNSKAGVKVVPASGGIADADDGGGDDEDDDNKKKKTSCFHFGRSFGVLGVVVGYLFLGGFIFYSLEPDNFPTLIESTYFCAISLTTIGYGDYSVGTDAGKIVLIFYCIVGKFWQLFFFFFFFLYFVFLCCCFSTLFVKLLVFLTLFVKLLFFFAFFFFLPPLLLLHNLKQALVL